jgi:WhiB family redox-sensing transcriptional regulator
MSSVSESCAWARRSACREADPDLFFPEKGTSRERIAQAKAICGACPVREACLREALRIDDQVAICGGLTPAERRRLILPASGREQLSRFQARRLENRSARTIAMTQGADLLWWLVKLEQPVEQVAARLGIRPRALFQVWRMLVPAGAQRQYAPSSIEQVLAESSLSLRRLQQIGRPHEEIAVELGTSQNVVSGCLRVLAQRDEAVDRLAESAGGIEAAVKWMQAAEGRVRRECGYGLTVEDVIETWGRQIRRMHGEGMPLRHVAEQLGLCRETVRQAHHQMVRDPRGIKLTQKQMERVA